MEIFLSILIALFLGFVSATCATQRGRNPTNWFFIGSFFGIFGLMALFLMKPLSVPEQPDTESEDAANAFDWTEEEPVYSSDNEWFYLEENNEQKGPVPFNEVQALFEQGALTAETYVWSEGMEDWLKIKEIDLFQ